MIPIEAILKSGKLMFRTVRYRAAKIFLLAGCCICLLILSGCHQQMTGVLNPKGVITYQERELLFDALALMLIVVIPVIIMSFAFVFRYRASHRTSEYKPNWGHNVFLESIWWGIPCVIILILGILTWRNTHQLDPYRKIPVQGKPMLIKAIALPWKWLFIYPKQNIATINYLVIPRGQQVEFWFTSDNVPMSAFFVPQIGSQIYTMAGMRTRLHLLATEDGVFEGLNAQYNGDGFSDMHFKTKVVEPDELQAWISQVKQSTNKLTQTSYQALLKPTIAEKVTYFSAVEPNLFDSVIKTYHLPATGIHPRAQNNSE